MDDREAARQSVWRRHWFQVLIATLAGLGVCWLVLPTVWSLVYATRSVLLPVVIAFALAYIANPVVGWAQRRLRIPRWGSVAIVLLVGLVALAGLGFAVVPPLVSQGRQLFTNARDVYPDRLAQWLDIEPDRPAPKNTIATQRAAPGGAGDAKPAKPRADAGGKPETPANPSAAPPANSPLASSPPKAQPRQDSAQTRPGSSEHRVVSISELWESRRVQEMVQRARDYLQNLQWKQVARFLAKSADIGVGVAGAAISFTSYFVIAAVVIVFCFVFFCAHFDTITAWFVPFIPASRRARTLEIIAKMDHCVAAFVRGRLLQAAIMATILSIGWWIVGVPSPLLLGVLGGALNLIPYAAFVGFLAALALTAIDHATGGSALLWAVGGATVVYLIAQGIDGWVVEPTVQGRATNLDPVTVLLVVLLGASLAGLLGMIIAIPTAACIKILSHEVIMPRLRAMAARH